MGGFFRGNTESPSLKACVTLDERKQEALARQIVRLAENAADVDQRGTRRTRGLGYPGGQIVLIDHFADEYDELVRTFLGHADWGEKFSEKYIDKSLRALFGDVLAEDEAGASIGEKVLVGLKAIVAHLEDYSEEHICYVPLVGLRLLAGDVELGQVVLKEMSEEEVDQLVATVEAIIRSTKGPEQDKQPLIAMQEAMLRGLQGTVCAVFHATAEPDKARERAEEETRRALDLLRFTIPALFDRRWNVAVGFLGEIFRTSRITPTLSDARFNVNVTNVGPHMDLDLSESEMEVMRQVGVLEVGDILRKPPRDLSDFEETLLHAVHWFANAEAQPELENKLLSLITCLETFLTPQGNSPIRTTVAEGVAIIVAEGVENRKRIRKFILGVYDKRSAVSHGGRTAVLQTDLVQLQDVAHVLIRTLIQRKGEFARRQDLATWLMEQRLA